MPGKSADEGQDLGEGFERNRLLCANIVTVSKPQTGRSIERSRLQCAKRVAGLKP